MVGVLLSLQLHQRRNRLSARFRDKRRLQGAVVGAVFLGYLAFRYGGGMLAVVSKTGSLPVADMLTAQLSCSIVFLWVTFPLIYGGQGNLDVRLLQLLPLRPVTIAAGIAAGFVLSPFFWLTALVVALLASTFPRAMDHLPLVALAVVAWTLLCGTTGQFVRAGADLLSRQRHARDLLLLVSTVVGVVPAVFFYLIRAQYASAGDGAASLGLLGLVPVAWPGVALASAAVGDAGTALLALLGVAALVTVEVLVWIVVIRRSMLSEDASTQRRNRRGDVFRSFARRLPHDRRGAVAALTQRLLLRDPGRLPGAVIGSVLFGGLFVFAGSDILAQVAGTAYTPLAAVLVTVVIMMRRANELGQQVSELWMNTVARGRARDDVLGRDLANILIDGPVVVVAIVAVAVAHADGSRAIPALLFAIGAIATTYAVMHGTAVVFAEGEDRAKDGLSTQTRQGMRSTLAALVGWVLAVAPVAGLVAVGIRYPAWMLPVSLVALVGGLAVWFWSAGSVGAWLDRHQADLVQRLRPA